MNHLTPRETVAFGMQRILNGRVTAGQIIKVMEKWGQQTPSSLHMKLLGKPTDEGDFPLGGWQEAAFSDDFPLHFQEELLEAWHQALLELLRLILMNKGQREELIDDLIKDLALPKKSLEEDEFLETFNELVNSAEGQQHMQDVADIIDGKRPLK